MDDPFTVLVVDDDQDLREALSDILASEGLAVATAADGRAALEALRQGLRPALILLDLMMPAMSGWEALSVLRSDRALADIPVAVLSAVGSQDRPRGATHVLRKPVDIDALLDLLRQITGLPGGWLRTGNGGRSGEPHPHPRSLSPFPLPHAPSNLCGNAQMADGGGERR